MRKEAMYENTLSFLMKTLYFYRFHGKMFHVKHKKNKKILPDPPQDLVFTKKNQY